MAARLLDRAVTELLHLRGRARDWCELAAVAYRDYPVSKGCTSPFAPIWINEMVRRQS